MSLEGVEDIRILVWDFDGVLNRAAPAACLPAVARDLGLDAAGLSAVFAHDPALLEGREDLLDRLEAWLAPQGAADLAEEVLETWLEAAFDPDPDLSRLVEALAEAGVAQVLLANLDRRRARWITQDAGWGERFDAVFASSSLGVALPGAFAPAETALAVAPAQLLRIDANPARVEAAEKRGWLGWDYTPGGARALALALMPLLVGGTE